MALGLGIARSLSVIIIITIIIIIIIIIFINLIFTISDIESGHQSLRAVAGRSRHRRRLSARVCRVRAQLGCASNAQWRIYVVESCSNRTKWHPSFTFTSHTYMLSGRVPAIV